MRLGAGDTRGPGAAMEPLGRSASVDFRNVLVAL